MSDCNCPLKEAARDAPTHLALIAKNVAYTFSALDLIVEKWKLHLHRLGIEAGDRIAVLSPTSTSLIALFFATWRLNASICPLNLRLPPTQIASCVERLAPQLFIDSFPYRGKPVIPGPREKGPSQSLLLFTSGSTAVPKIAVLTLESLIASAESFGFVQLHPQDRWLLSLPLFHVGGIGIVLRCILARACIVLDEKDPAITHLSYVPTQLFRSTPIYPHLKCLLLGGAPIPSYPKHLPVYGTFGLTEMGSWVTARKSPPKIEGHFYLGHPLPGREVQLSPTGEIFVRGKTRFQGYWTQGRCQPPEEWFATGDIGHLDPKEGLAIIGRKDWQFISGGENIQPEEIESQIMQIPGILEAVVVPVQDPEFGQRPAACIRTHNPHFCLAHLQRALQEMLPKYKIPTSLFILEEMPKQGFKIDRKALFDFVCRNYFKVK